MTIDIYLYKFIKYIEALSIRIIFVLHEGSGLLLRHFTFLQQQI